MIYKITTLFTLAALTGMVTYWIADRKVPVTVIERNPITPVVEQGDYFRLNMKNIRHDMCHTKVDSFLYDGMNTRIILPAQEFVVSPSPLGYNEFGIAVKVPIDAMPGDAKYSTIVEYRCNPFHYFWPIITGPNDVAFKIIPKE